MKTFLFLFVFLVIAAGCHNRDGEYFGNTAQIYVHGDTLKVDNMRGCDTLWYDDPIYRERIAVAPRECMEFYAMEGKPVTFYIRWKDLH